MTSADDPAGLASAVAGDWVLELSGPEPARHAAQLRLHALLLRVAFHELSRRGSAQGIAGPERDDLAHQAADDAMVAVLAKLDQFRGESRFTTWAYRFVVLEVSAKLGRHYWRRPEARSVDLDEGTWERFADRMGLGPEDDAAAADLAGALRRAIDALTLRQREIFVDVVVAGIPLDALVVRLDTNRNAIYKTVFDARRKIRAALVAEGYLTEDSGGAR